MNTPDITQAQGGAVAQFGAVVIGAHAAGIADTGFVAVVVASAVLGAAVVISDAVIRRGRALLAASATLDAADPDDIIDPDFV